MFMCKAGAYPRGKELKEASHW